ncbi:LysR family transcriptional regulator [Rhizobium sp. L1K21]|uniref:LysR family transcriptional regulator n=1 Tax=Rhizobium sp. L1K21 TaxID=2954933 RepID=UPI0020926050|nr:LysR family transcriptional regulator [Rhizobium sp. L1K21]MCO6187919.1 LysR family transcriptional regulator [Rhizobium sp. L1K21]
MRFKKLDMNLLVALDILIRTRSVTRSANEIGITQSAMSNALTRLRTFFDDPLLVQVGRRMELSPLAESLADPVRDIMVRVESAVLVNPTFDATRSSRAFSIVLSDYSLQMLGAHLSELVAREAPNIQLNFRPQHMTPYKLLESGDIDLLIAPEFVCSDSHPREAVFSDPMRVLACINGPFAQELTVDQFRQAQHVMMVPLEAQQSYAAMQLRQKGVDVELATTTYAFSSIPAMVRNTRRIAVVQGEIARHAVIAGGLAAHEPPIPIPPLVQAMQWHKMRSRDAGLEWLRAAIRSCFKTIESERN